MRDTAFCGVTSFQTSLLRTSSQSNLQECRAANNKDGFFFIYRKEHQLKKKKAFEKEGRASNFCLIIFLISNSDTKHKSLLLRTTKYFSLGPKNN